MVKDVNLFKDDSNKVNYLQDIYCVSSFSNKLMFKSPKTLSNLQDNATVNYKYNSHNENFINENSEYLNRIAKVKNPCFINYPTKVLLNVKGINKDEEIKTLKKEFEDFNDNPPRYLEYNGFDICNNVYEDENKRLDFTPDECMYAEFFRYKYDKFNVDIPDERIHELLLNNNERGIVDHSIVKQPKLNLYTEIKKVKRVDSIKALKKPKRINSLRDIKMTESEKFENVILTNQSKNKEQMYKRKV